MPSVVLSFIIVHYGATEELFACLASIKKYHPVFSYEIIVIDNDETPVIEKKLKEKFPTVGYLKTPKNGGYGYGLNSGAKVAKGEYLFFLNEDTTFLTDTGSILVNFLKKKKNAIVAPLLMDKKKTAYPQQGARTLGVLEGIVVLSFFNKYFPNNPIAKSYWLHDVDRTQVFEVDVVPGTAFMCSTSTFASIGGFDEHFRLYFEEMDFCKRAKALGVKIYIEPAAHIMHAWGKSTVKNQVYAGVQFQKSRMYYFRKHYGVFAMCLVELFARQRRIFHNRV